MFLTYASTLKQLISERALKGHIIGNVTGVEFIACCNLQSAEINTKSENEISQLAEQ